MAFQLIINTDKIVSFQLPKNGEMWGSKLDMEFELPASWNTAACCEYISTFIRGMGVCPYRNFTTYEHNVDPAIEALNAAAVDILDCNGEMSYAQTFGDHELSVVLRTVE